MDEGNSESWKSSLIFTGQNPTYPVELFVRIMERKYGVSVKKATKSNTGSIAKACKLILEHIPDEGDAPATSWKRTHLKQQKNPHCWRSIRKDLIRCLGRMKEVSAIPTAYSIKDKLVLLDSLKKSAEEKLSTYCIRAHFVASVLEHSSVRGLSLVLYRTGLNTQLS